MSNEPLITGFPRAVPSGSVRRLPPIRRRYQRYSPGELPLCLERGRFTLSCQRLFASDRSARRTLSFAGTELPVETLDHDGFAGVDIALFSAGSAAPFRAGGVPPGTVVVGNSSAFRMEAAASVAALAS
jgi:hypothetical protein